MDSEQIIKLGKSLEDAKKLLAEVQDLKLEKSRLERNTKCLQKARQELQNNYNNDKQEKETEIGKLENSIRIFEARRSNLASSTIPETERLSNLKQETDKKLAALDNRTTELDGQSDRQKKENNRIEDKKDIIAQIVELAKGL